TLRPGVIGSIFALPLADRSVDVSACFQMLEHLPFDCFTPALAELRRVTAGAAVVSLPDCSLALTLRIGRLNPRRDGIVVCRTLQPAGWALRRFKTVPNAAGHYWEIGRKGTPLTVVRRAITAAGWRIESETRPAENAYHRFFVLR
ncbi:MAG TPA: class I SAM-dependent methyltransferase, partial [Tepidisphaeraceae bacterium]|nr:class I SAM-dependent methyltransferase [Tepidisphaeraceae bacterium]